MSRGGMAYIMKLVIAVESRFARIGDDFFAIGSPGPYIFWQQYLEYFDHVTVVARVRKLDKIPQGCARACGPGVSILPLPDYEGLINGLTRIPLIMGHLWRFTYTQRKCCYILRIPGVIGTLLWIILTILRIPYAIDLVGDPNEALGRIQSGSEFTARVVRPIMTFLTKIQCKNALAIHYVTWVLKQRYSPSQEAVIGVWSDVVLPEVVFMPSSQKSDGPEIEKPVIVFVGSLQRPYKGLDVLLRAFRAVTEDFPNAELWVIGDGILRSQYEKMAVKLGISNKVMFWGQVEQTDVFKILAEATLFVLPSFTEGLPRALIEAMAMGLPCIATHVGGIPDLLPEEVLVAPGDACELYIKMKWMLGSTSIRKTFGEMNRTRILLDFNPQKLKSYIDSYFRSLRCQLGNTVKASWETRK